MAFELITAKNGVGYFRSTLIQSRHGFATRIGGVSRQAHTASLNLAFGRGDDDKTVLENLRLFSDAVGIDSHSIISRPQIHSARVLCAGYENRGEGYFIKTDDGCDGYVTNREGVTLGIKTADCVPIIFEDAEALVIGAVHAGWRGTAANIVSECISAMTRVGAEPRRIHAAVGPAIHSCCYEVSEDFRYSVSELSGQDVAESFIKPRGGKLYADIVGMNERFMLESGLVCGNIDICPECTCHNPELFFSHRYSKGVRGTMLSVIAL